MKQQPTTLNGLSSAHTVRHEHDQFKFAVSGAADTTPCGEKALDVARELGREIVRHNAVLITGATTGFPLWSAMGAKDEKGISVGISPASSEKEHREVYKLPVDYMDLIIYTGAGFPGRDLLFTRTSDAIFIGCGRIGTFHEFTIAFEDRKPIGILDGPWHTDELIKEMIESSGRADHDPFIVFDKDPKRLVERVIEMVVRYKQMSPEALAAIGTTGSKRG